MAVEHSHVPSPDHPSPTSSPESHRNPSHAPADETLCPLAGCPDRPAANLDSSADAQTQKRALLEIEALPLMDLVYSVARRMVGDEAKAEDLVQETYLRAFRSIDQYALGSNCKAWLLTILRSVYIDAARQSQSRGGAHEQLPHDVQAHSERLDLPIDPARFMTILDVMVDDDIRDAMLHVPELYREAFVMVVIAELPYKEAAAVLGVQEGTVKSRVFRACQMLKGRLWNYAVERRLAKPEEAAAPTPPADTDGSENESDIHTDKNSS